MKVTLQVGDMFAPDDDEKVWCKILSIKQRSKDKSGQVSVPTAPLENVSLQSLQNKRPCLQRSSTSSIRLSSGSWPDLPLSINLNFNVLGGAMETETLDNSSTTIRRKLTNQTHDINLPYDFSRSAINDNSTYVPRNVVFSLSKITNGYIRIQAKHSLGSHVKVNEKKMHIKQNPFL